MIPAPRDQAGQQAVGDGDERVDIGRDHRAPLGQVAVLCGLGAEREAGIVDEPVDLGKFGRQAVQRGIERILIGDVEGQRMKGRPSSSARAWSRSARRPCRSPAIPPRQRPARCPPRSRRSRPSPELSSSSVHLLINADRCWYPAEPDMAKRARCRRPQHGPLFPAFIQVHGIQDFSRMAGRAERRQDGRRERLAWIIRRASRDESPVTVGAVPSACAGRVVRFPPGPDHAARRAGRSRDRPHGLSCPAPGDDMVGGWVRVRW